MWQLDWDLTFFTSSYLVQIKKMWESFIICQLTSIANFYERYPFIWSRFKITTTKSNANVLILVPDGQSFSQWKSVGLCQKFTTFFLASIKAQKECPLLLWLLVLWWLTWKCLSYVISKTFFALRSKLKKGVLSYSDSSSPTFTGEKRTGHSIFAKTAKTSC